ncbi:MAG: hypothetical protein WD470_09530 [Rhodospirillaceae bacterium]
MHAGTPPETARTAPLAPLEAQNDAVLGALDGICYVTDCDGRIRQVGQRNWERFARENDAPELLSASVVGRSVFDFMSGNAVQTELRNVFRTLKTRERERWLMPFRCDSPGERRNMRLSITPIDGKGGVAGFLFQSILLSVETRPPIDLFDFKALSGLMAELRDLPLVRMCSYCQRVNDEEHTHGDWQEAERYYALGGTSQVRISHGICGPCRIVVEAAYR